MIKDYLQKLAYESEVIRLKGEVLQYIRGYMRQTHNEGYVILIGGEEELVEVCHWCAEKELGVSTGEGTTTVRITLL